jgi:hypothetical protein
LYAAVYIGAGKYHEAERVIRRLKSTGDDDGRADSRTAQIMMLRDRNYRGAQEVLTSILQRGTRGAIPTRRLRAFAAALAGNDTVAREDAEWLRGQVGVPEVIHYIEARILLQKKRYEEALAELAKASSKGSQDALQKRQDALLRARILEAQADDPAIPLATRQTLRGEVGKLRRQYAGVSEFEEP